MDPTFLLATAAPAAAKHGGGLSMALALILFLGVGAQWLAWRLRLPSILLLLLFGFLAGPVAHAVTPHWFGRTYSLDPAALFGEELLLALVSLAVGLILFEGGLTLNWREISSVRSVVRNLVTVGAGVTWVIAAVAAHYLLGLIWPVAILLGAVLIVTGPTVIGPLLRHVRPTGSVGSVLKWEGIVIDPIGAMAAVLTFEAILGGLGRASPDDAAGAANVAIQGVGGFLRGAALTGGVGIGIGVVAAVLLVVALRRFWIPDYLQTPMTFMLVAGAFVASNAVVPESGLFTTTVMGVVLANQQKAHVRHIVEFKETLTVLLIAALFIVLSSRLELSAFSEMGWGAAGFVAVLVLIARPAAVYASTWGSKLTHAERLFLSWMAPRGIVAAAVASVFGLSLSSAGVPGANLLVPYTFLTIIATVALYGLTAAFVAARLGLAKAASTGFLIAGAHPLARMIATALAEEELPVMVADTNHGNIQAARLAGLPTTQGNVLSGQVQERIELTGIGRLIAMTPNDEVNSLAALQYAKHFGRSNVFQLDRPTDKKRKKGEVDEELNGRVLFGEGLGFRDLLARVDGGSVVRKTRLSKEFTFEHFAEQNGPDFVPLFLIGETGDVQTFTADKPLTPKAGQTLISLSRPPTKEVMAAKHAAKRVAKEPRDSAA